MGCQFGPFSVYVGLSFQSFSGIPSFSSREMDRPSTRPVKLLEPSTSVWQHPRWKASNMLSQGSCSLPKWPCRKKSFWIFVQVHGTFHLLRGPTLSITRCKLSHSSRSHSMAPFATSPTSPMLLDCDTNLLGDDGGQSTEEVALAVDDDGLRREGRHLEGEDPELRSAHMQWM